MKVQKECRQKETCPEVVYLRRRLREFEAVFEYCHDGISMVDKNGVIVWSNPAMQELYRLSDKYYVGKNVAELVEEGVLNTSVSAKVFETGQRVSVLQNISTGVRCLTTGTPIFGDDGQVEMVVVTSHDVTELYALRERLRQSQKLADGYHAELTDIRAT